MSQAKTVAKNTFSLFLGEAVNKVLSFLLIFMIARSLGSSELGKYSFAFAFIGFALFFSNLGAIEYMIREIAKFPKHAKKLYDHVFTLRLMILGVMSLSLVAVVLLWDKLTNIFLIAFMIIGIEVLRNLSQNITAVFQGKEKMEYVALVTIIERILSVLFSFIVLWQGFGLRAVVVVLLSSQLIAYIIGLVVLKKTCISPGMAVNLPYYKSIIRHSLPFLVSNFFYIMLFRIDTIILTAFTTYSIVGVYAAAAKIIEALAAIPVILIRPVYPIMSRLSLKGGVKDIGNKLVYYMVVLAVPMVIGTMMLSERLIQIVYPADFSAASLILRILIVGAGFVFLNFTMGYMLNSIGKEKKFTLSNTIVAGLNILLNLSLIPFFGMVGAALATVISQFTNSILLFLFTAREKLKVRIFHHVQKPLIASFVMGVLIYLIRSFSILLIVPSAMITYAIFFYFIGGIGEFEKRFLREVMKR
ncbi:flippase [Candidatus Woesearchaeota archaeon]|nr:flippase [Candidatus Woesearchaeota archaeon]